MTPRKTPPKVLSPDELRFIRVAKGWSQAQMARVLRAARSTYSRWETPVGTKNHRAMPPLASDVARWVGSGVRIPEIAAYEADQRGASRSRLTRQPYNRGRRSDPRPGGAGLDVEPGSRTTEAVGGGRAG